MSAPADLERELAAACGDDEWALDVVVLLARVADYEGECWCVDLDEHTPCIPCVARDLLERAPVAVPEIDWPTQRRVERVEVTGGRV